MGLRTAHRQLVWAGLVLLAALGACSDDSAPAESPGLPDRDGGSSDGDASDGGLATGLRTHVSPDLAFVGAAVNADALANDATYKSLLANDFNSVTPENAMKWGEVHPAADTWKFDASDALVAFAVDHGQRIRGHTLVWHEQLPADVNDTMTAQALRDAINAHIDGLVGRYKGKIAAWDVVNEAIDDAAKPRDSVFSRKLGTDYIELAFNRARAADPNAKLFYNDYDIEWPNAKSDAVLALLTTLKQKGVPIDGVGMQFHVLGYDFASFDLKEAAIRKRMQDFGALGLQVEITELDVRMASLPPAASKPAYQASVFQRLVAICRTEPACTAVTFWGFTDKYSWVDGAFGPDDPLLYDDALAPKPAYQGVLAGLDGTLGPGFDFGFDTACGTLSSPIWCAPFEALTLGPRDYTVASSGLVEVQTGTRYRGARALKASTQAVANAQAIVGRRALSPAVTSGTIWARLYVNIPTATSASTLTVFALGENDPPYHAVSIGLSGGKVQLSLTTTNQFAYSAGNLPRDTFKCLELEVNVAASGGSANAYLDGAQVASITGQNTLPAGGISNVNVGILYAAPSSAAYAAYVDEPAVGRTRLPCD